MAKVNCCRDQQLAWSLWLGLQASCSHQTWRGHGQIIGPGIALVRFIVSCPMYLVTPMIYRQVSVKLQK